MITIAALTLGGLVPLLIELIVIGLICGLLWWLVGFIALPEPFNRVARILIAVVAVVLVINMLLSLTGSRFITY